MAITNKSEACSMTNLRMAAPMAVWASFHVGVMGLPASERSSVSTMVAG